MELNDNLKEKLERGYKDYEEGNVMDARTA